MALISLKACAGVLFLFNNVADSIINSILDLVLITDLRSFLRTLAAALSRSYLRRPPKPNIENNLMLIVLIAA